MHRRHLLGLWWAQKLTPIGVCGIWLLRRMAGTTHKSREMGRGQIRQQGAGEFKREAGNNSGLRKYKQEKYICWEGVWPQEYKTDHYPLILRRWDVYLGRSTEACAELVRQPSNATGFPPPPSFSPYTLSRLARVHRRLPHSPKIAAVGPDSTALSWYSNTGREGKGQRQDCPA